MNESYYYWVSATNNLGTSPLSDSDRGFHSPSRSPNDAFVDRIVLEGVLANASGTNLDATEESGEPTHAGVGVERAFGGRGHHQLLEVLK